MNRIPAFYRFYPGRHSAAVSLLKTSKKKADYLDKLLYALNLCQTGICPAADDMILDTVSYLENQSKAGSEGAAKRWGRHGVAMGSPSAAMGSPCLPMAIPVPVPNPKPVSSVSSNAPAKPKPTGTGFKSKRAGTESDRGDGYETIAGLAQQALPEYAAKFCRESDPGLSIRAYKKAIGIIGPEKFRECLATFSGTVRAGEDCPNRGATFLKHYLRPAMAAQIQKNEKQ